MENKRMITGMIAAMMVILGYKLVIDWLWKKNNWTMPQQQAAATQPIEPTTGTSSTTESSSVASASTAPSTSAPTTQASGIRVVGARSVEPATIGSTAEKDPTYAMGINIIPQGAAVDQIALNEFKLQVGKPEPYTFDQAQDVGADERALASRNITINGQSIDLANVNWELEDKSAGEATYGVDVQNNGEKLARVRKTYRIDSRPESKGKSEGYEVVVTFAVQNLSSAPITVNTSFNGPLPPRPETSRGPDRNVIGGYDNSGEIEINHHAIEELKPENPKRDLTKSEKTSLPLVWAGIGGTYFDSIVRPLPPGQEMGVAPYIQSVEAASIHPEIPRDHPQVRLTFATADEKIEPNGTASHSMRVFFGPKARTVVTNKYYSASLIHFDKTLVMTSGICGYCAIEWLINSLVWLMIAFHWIFGGFAGHGDWGLAIVALVVLVRLILHPITKKSQVNMLKMSKMGPEMERLKKKYGDDKEAIAKAQMDLYKEMGFTPVLGCLPMFLQMPIFISLWQALQSTFELRHAPFLWFGRLHLSWIGDLSQPDRLLAFGHPIPLIFGWHMDAINVLPILVAIVSFLNMKYTPRPPAATPEAEQQQKMMQWMTLVFPLMFYNFPSGLNIYYLTSTSLGIWEGKRIRQHIKDHEAAEKEGKVIVDASPGRRRPPPTSGLNKASPKPTGGLGGWLARLQEKVDDIAQTEKKRKKS